jgi:hypothetical protein
VSTIVELTVAALRDLGGSPSHRYMECLCAACAAFPPPFGMAWYGEKYRNLAVNRDWFATSLVVNAVKEAEGARDLWRLAGRTGDPAVAERIRLHAIDESRHARLYVAMLDIAFREALPEDVRPALYGLSPRYNARQRPPVTDILPAWSVLDALIQINLGEIRTRIHQLLLTPVITEYCPAERYGALKGILRALLRDETRHIEYTAALIEDAIVRGEADFVRQTMAARLDEFNQLTLTQVGEACFSGS